MDDLAVRAKLSCKSTYALTADDINALMTSSTTSVQGMDAFNNTVHDNDSASVSLHQVNYSTRERRSLKRPVYLQGY